MGKKSSSTKIPASVGEAMKQQAAVAQQQQDWMENEMFPWLQEQANISNENAEKDREFNQANAEWWQNYAQENADKLNEKADWYFDRFQNTYAPIEDSLIKDMERYNDGVEAERQAGYAIGDIASSFATQRRSNAMRAQAYGINPTSGAYQAQQRAMDLQQASLSAAAANQARNAAQQLGWQKKLQVAGLGDKYIGAAQGMYQTGNQTASTGGSLSQNAANQASSLGGVGFSNAQAMANIGLQSYGSLQNAWGNVANTGLQAWQAQQQIAANNQANQSSMIGGVIGTVGTVAAAF
jgi:hypothetical protein